MKLTTGHQWRPGQSIKDVQFSTGNFKQIIHLIVKGIKFPKKMLKIGLVSENIQKTVSTNYDYS